MKKVLYYFRKYFIFAYFPVAIALVIIFRESLMTSNSMWIMLLLVIGLMVSFYMRPNPNNYAKNGEKYLKKITFEKTTEAMKEKKDGTKKITYTHHFICNCKTPDGKFQHKYEILKDGGYCLIDIEGKEHFKKIDKKLYLRDMNTFR